jgi:hypothetical protein
MNDAMPDFEQTTVPPANEYPKPKKPRRKPTRKKARKAAVLVDRSAAIRFGKAKAKKRKAVAKRRGRPPGALGKPKIAATVTAEMRTDVVAFIQNVLGIAVEPWRAKILRNMLREA